MMEDACGWSIEQLRWSLIAAALAALFLAHDALADLLSGRVVKIADGDTLTILDTAKRQHKVRLAGIDAPEKAQPFGTRSKQSLAELCAGKVAEVDAREKDRYGRTSGRVIRYRSKDNRAPSGA